MPHAFSVEIHDYLSNKILLVGEGIKQAVLDKDQSLESYHKGQLLELEIIRRYLTDNIDLKTQKYF
ncbi:MAG TPA: hypothetical protein EYP35_02640 [Desulfobacterales bacterium]|nr:hypothetical protein [Desulfobacterales bacterium]HIP40508.1 hypothetical protein [Desulfocapsa sulfexigens]